MEGTFKNHTNNDMETNLRACVYMTKKPRMSLLVLGILFIVLGVTMILLDVFLSEEKDYFVGILILVLAVLVLVLYFLYPLILKITYKRMAQGKETAIDFTFNDEGYSLEQTGAVASTSAGGWDTFTLCKEYSDMWLLYINKASVFIILKDGMTEGSWEELGRLFQEKLGANYKVCYKKR